MEKFKELATYLGIDASDLDKIEKGELKVEDFGKTFIEKFETNVVSRHKTELEKNVRGEVMGQVWSMAEEKFIKEFGIDAKEYETVEKNKRLETMLKHAKEKQTKLIEEVKNADGAKLVQLTEQLQLANEKIKHLETDVKTQVESVHKEYQAKEQKRYVDTAISDLTDKIENPAYPKKVMVTMVKAELQAKGYGQEVDKEGRIWITKDGVPVKNPKRPMENIQLSDFFSEVAETEGFLAKNHGGGGGSGGGGKYLGDRPAHIHPDAWAEMQKNRK